MSRTLPALLFTVGFVAMVGCPAPKPVPGLKTGGRVVDALGQPLEGATVTVRIPGRASGIVTSKDGTYVLGAITDLVHPENIGEASIRIDKEGYRPVVMPIRDYMGLDMPVVLQAGVETKDSK